MRIFYCQNSIQNKSMNEWDRMGLSITIGVLHLVLRWIRLSCVEHLYKSTFGTCQLG